MFVDPMLLHKSDPINSDDNIVELKLDGIRVIYSTLGLTPRIYTRHNNEITERFPELIALDIPKGTVLDGELIALDADGKPDFEAVMKRFMSRKKSHIPIQYCVFDVLYREGQAVMGLPLWQRKEILEQLIDDGPHIAKIRYYDGNVAESLYQLCGEQGLEGIVTKKANSIYQPGKRSDSWLKSVCYQHTDVYIAGYRKGEFGWLLGKDGRYVGVLELGVSPNEKKAFYGVCNSIKTNETKDYVYLEPEKIHCRVKYRNWTKKGLLRLPVFERFIV